MNEYYNAFMQDLEAEYPKHQSQNSTSSNYGRPMKIKLKSGQIFGAVWFRWEHQNATSLQSQTLCFNVGGDRFNLKFEDIESVSWD